MKIIVPCSKCLTPNRVDLHKATDSQPICGRCKVYLPLHDGVQDVNANTLNKLVTNSEIPIVVDFWASWCGPCQMFAPIFTSTAQSMSDSLVFAKFDTENDPHGSQLYRIQSIPTLIVFKNGIEVDRQSGAMSKSAFAAYLTKFTQ